jgi:hypothetical protein
MRAYCSSSDAACLSTWVVSCFRNVVEQESVVTAGILRSVSGGAHTTQPLASSRPIDDMFFPVQSKQGVRYNVFSISGSGCRQASHTGLLERNRAMEKSCLIGEGERLEKPVLTLLPSTGENWDRLILGDAMDWVGDPSPECGVTDLDCCCRSLFFSATAIECRSLVCDIFDRISVMDIPAVSLQISLIFISRNCASNSFVSSATYDEAEDVDPTSILGGRAKGLAAAIFSLPPNSSSNPVKFSCLHKNYATNHFQFSCFAGKTDMNYRSSLKRNLLSITFWLCVFRTDTHTQHTQKAVQGFLCEFLCCCVRVACPH